MKEYLWRNLLWLVCTLLLGAVAVCGFFSEDSTLAFSLETGGASVRIEPYREENGDVYVFLPSWAELEQVRAVVPRHTPVWLDEKELKNSMDCGALALDTPYRLRIGMQAAVTVRFLRSENLPAVFIQTASGSMTRIHEDKTYEEKATVLVITEAGLQDTADGGATLKGRGNATWKYEKKPYSLSLSGDMDLLGMGGATDWVLLANATDQSNLHNYLALTLAAGSGLEWTPECRFVDLYLNGEYHGLYLLTEKVELDPERLGADFLCKIDFASRWDTLRNPFKTESGRTVEITEPKAPSTAQSGEIQALVNRMEQGIGSGSLEQVDLDSWVRRYLVDEITGNIDADLASSYFYGKDGLVYAGPVWDYDRSFGNTPRNENPRSFIAKNRCKSGEILSPYYSALYENEAFRARVAELYRAEFLPQLESWTGGGIEEAADRISASARMNDIRWESMFAHLQETDPDPRALTEYISRRTEFLCSAWLDGANYCTVQLEVAEGGFYRNFAVKKGTALDLQELEAFLGAEATFPAGIDLSENCWTDSRTGETVSLKDPVYEDAILRFCPAP